MRALTTTLMLAITMLASKAVAEQFRQFGRYQAHYIVVNTKFLEPDVATRLDLTRSGTTALLNISILDSELDNAGTTPVPADVTGVARNLLGTIRKLKFREIREGEAIYYVATLRFTEQEHWRFAIDLQMPDGSTHELAFQQQLYVQ